MADHVGGTRGRRYYEHLSDDEDLVASGGKVAPGGWVSPWVGVTLDATGAVPIADGGGTWWCLVVRWRWVGATVGGRHCGWASLWVGVTTDATRAVPIADGSGTWWHLASKVALGGCHPGWVPPWVRVTMSGCHSCCPHCRWQRDLVASIGKVARGATGGCHPGWVSPWAGATLDATRAVPTVDGSGTWWHLAVRWHWVGGCYHGWVSP